MTFVNLTYDKNRVRINLDQCASGLATGSTTRRLDLATNCSAITIYNRQLFIPPLYLRGQCLLASLCKLAVFNIVFHVAYWHQEASDETFSTWPIQVRMAAVIFAVGSGSQIASWF
jgi:hypothetical protein